MARGVQRLHSESLLSAQLRLLTLRRPRSSFRGQRASLLSSSVRLCPASSCLAPTVACSLPLLISDGEGVEDDSIEDDSIEDDSIEDQILNSKGMLILPWLFSLSSSIPSQACLQESWIDRNEIEVERNFPKEMVDSREERG
ncbi:hypothetical protein B0T17DRAFT_602981 [Bombardia bombarda]|uniref:Uncharacterized protein n=1 Tax=Bombardia bombarda TaxID=252184 RepID=A0AA39WD17_9PEZI|nr:hypothetical protein B0T17DRAFT_602981 [Bombardia bombarda]